MGSQGAWGAFDGARRHGDGFAEAAPDLQMGAREGLARYEPDSRPPGAKVGGYRDRGTGSTDAADVAVRSRQLAFALQAPLSGAQSASTDRPAETPDEAPNPQGGAASKPTLRAVAQVLQMYVVAEDGDAVYLIDQHAAHERVLYERFRAAAQARGLQSLPLLVPLTIEVRAQDADGIEAAAPSWTSSGLVVERFGDHAFVVRAVPHIWEGLDLLSLVQDVFADELAQRLGTREERTGERAARSWQEQLILRSCKAAVKANQKLTLPELDALLASLALLENPFTCPHGRPTAIRMTRAQLEREFRRTL